MAKKAGGAAGILSKVKETDEQGKVYECKFSELFSLLRYNSILFLIVTTFFLLKKMLSS